MSCPRCGRSRPSALPCPPAPPGSHPHTHRGRGTPRPRDTLPGGDCRCQRPLRATAHLQPAWQLGTGHDTHIHRDTRATHAHTCIHRDTRTLRDTCTLRHMRHTRPHTCAHWCTHTHVHCTQCPALPLEMYRQRLHGAGRAAEVRPDRQRELPQDGDPEHGRRGHGEGPAPSPTTGMSGGTEEGGRGVGESRLQRPP